MFADRQTFSPVKNRLVALAVFHPHACRYGNCVTNQRRFRTESNCCATQNGESLLKSSHPVNSFQNTTIIFCNNTGRELKNIGLYCIPKINYLSSVRMQISYARASAISVGLQHFPPSACPSVRQKYSGILP